VKTIKGGGIHRIKIHLACEKGQVEGCTKVYDELNLEMKNLLAFYQVDKSRAKKIKKYAGKSQDDDPFTIPSFEESSSFPIGLGVGQRDEVENAYFVHPRSFKGTGAS
jgi:hypothetical protein